MALPTLTGTARLTADPELRITTTGTTIARLNLAFNARKKDPGTGEWVDGDVFFVSATLFGSLAENACESLGKGVEVVVSGRLKTRQWETDGGEKRTAVELLVDEVGPALRWAQATVRKTGRTSPAAPAESSVAPPF